MNPTSLALFLGSILAIILTKFKTPNSKFLRIVFIGYGCLFLMILSEYITSTRAVFITDFRYYAYGGYFGIAAVSCFIGSFYFVKLSTRKIILARILGYIIAILFITYTLFCGVSTASQNALFGRQIEVAQRTAPNLFREAGITPNISDWHRLLVWKSHDLDHEIELRGKNETGFTNRFNWRTDGSNSLNVTYIGLNGPASFQMKIPIRNDELASPSGSIVVKALLQSSHSDRMPAVGISIEDLKTGKLLQEKWAVISSAWTSGMKPEEFACGVPYDPMQQKAFIRIYWAPKAIGESILIQGLSVGTPTE